MNIDIAPEKRLAVSVIVQALKDYHTKPTKKSTPERIQEIERDKESAETFLSGCGNILQFWCIVAEINPILVIKNFRNIDYKNLPKTQ